MKKILDKHPLFLYFLSAIIVLLLILITGIHEVKKEPNISNVKDVSGEIIEFKNSTGRRGGWLPIRITLDNNSTYKIYYGGRWATDVSLKDELLKHSNVSIKYIDKNNEIVHLEVDNKVIFTVEDYKIGYKDYHNFLHMMTMILFIVLSITIIVISIRLNNSKYYVEKKVKNSFLIRLKIREKFFMSFVVLIGPYYLIFSFAKLINLIENRTFRSFVFTLMIYCLFGALFLFIYFIKKIGYDYKLTKNEKKIYYKKDIITKIKILLFFSILGFIYIIPIKLVDNKMFYIINFIVIEFIILIFFIVNIIKIIKISLSNEKYYNENYIPKTIYDKFRNDEVKNLIRSNLKKHLKNYSIKSKYIKEEDEIVIIIKNEDNEIIISISKRKQNIKINEDFKSLNLKYNKDNTSDIYLELVQIINNTIN